jgi:hypothetical protein
LASVFCSDFDSLQLLLYDEHFKCYMLKGRLKTLSVRRRLDFSGEFLFISDHHSLILCENFLTSLDPFSTPPHISLIEVEQRNSVSRLRKYPHRVSKEWKKNPFFFCFVHSYFKNSIQHFPKGIYVKMNFFMHSLCIVSRKNAKVWHHKLKMSEKMFFFCVQRKMILVSHF